MIIHQSLDVVQWPLPTRPQIAPLERRQATQCVYNDLNYLVPEQRISKFIPMSFR